MNINKEIIIFSISLLLIIVAYIFVILSIEYVSKQQNIKYNEYQEKSLLKYYNHEINKKDD